MPGSASESSGRRSSVPPASLDAAEADDEVRCRTRGARSIRFRRRRCWSKPEVCAADSSSMYGDVEGCPFGLHANCPPPVPNWKRSELMCGCKELDQSPSCRHLPCPLLACPNPESPIQIQADLLQESILHDGGALDAYRLVGRTWEPHNTWGGRSARPADPVRTMTRNATDPTCCIASLYLSCSSS